MNCYSRYENKNNSMSWIAMDTKPEKELPEDMWNGGECTVEELGLGAAEDAGKTLPKKYLFW